MAYQLIFSLTLSMIGNFACVFKSADFFFKIDIIQNILHTISVKQFRSRSGRTERTGPDLGTNCLQMLSADDKSC